MTDLLARTGLSYDSYTEGEYMSVLQYLAAGEGSGPIGRDELADWITNAAAIRAELVAALEVAEAFAVRGPNPFSHDCQWCDNCVSGVVSARRAALERAR